MDMNEIRVTIHRNFCATQNPGEVHHACGSSDEGNADKAAEALVELSPERMKVYMHEYSSELTFSLSERGSSSELRLNGESAALDLLRFIATLPLRGESADAVRGMVKALDALPENISAIPLPGSLSLTSMGASLTLEAKTALGADEALNVLRHTVSPFGFAVRPA